MSVPRAVPSMPAASGAPRVAENPLSAGGGRLLRRREAVLLGLVCALLAVDFGWPLHGYLSYGLTGAVTALAVPWGLWIMKREQSGSPASPTIKTLLFRLCLLALGSMLLFVKWWLLLGVGLAEPERFAGASQSYTIALATILLAGLLGGGLRSSRIFALLADHPARLMAASFSGTGLFGAFLLSLPLSMQRVSELSFVDNLFTSFSAVCVTGLSVNTISQTYTLFGQAVICLLVQVGGMGIMVLSTAILMLAGQRLRVKSSAALAEIVDVQSLASLRRTVASIVVGTLVIELLGGLVLYQRFLEYPDILSRGGADLSGPGSAEWAAVFHAVSAFCNAGFSNFEGGLVPLLADPTVLGTIGGLSILGGIGFPVLQELFRRLGRAAIRRRNERLSLHTRICLRMTGLLLCALALALFVLERRASFELLGWMESIAAAAFQSATARSAGFNVVDVGAMRPATLMLLCISMFIGASPGSCGGGIKTTTVAVLFSGLRSELHARPAALLDRAIPPETTRRAMGVAFLSAGILAIALFLLLLIEPHEPLSVAFEAFSAFSNTGLSMGITPDLSVSGKLLVILMMFAGRIGPLTLALAFSTRRQPVPVQLPSERVLIG